MDGEARCRAAYRGGLLDPPLPPNERPVVEDINWLEQLFPRIHHERAIARDLLASRLAAHEEEARTIGTAGRGKSVAVTEDHKARTSDPGAPSVRVQTDLAAAAVEVGERRVATRNG